MAGTPKEEIKRIADQFAFTGELVSCGPCGSGHINETYMLRYRIGEMGSIKVILQKINREIFQKPEELMEIQDESTPLAEAIPDGSSDTSQGRPAGTLIRFAAIAGAAAAVLAVLAGVLIFWFKKRKAGDR